MMNEEIKHNEDKNFIKIWPYLDDISQAIIPYSSNHLSKDKNMVVNLDFSNVKRINSSGATITLKKLISLVLWDKHPRPFKLIMPKKDSMDVPEAIHVEKYMQNSGFLSILDSYFHFGKYYGDLFEQPQLIEININTKNHITFDEQLSIKRTAFPIFHLKYNPIKERESVKQFSEWLDNNILSILDNYNIKTDNLFSVFTEIAKNSQDHTEKDAFFGIDLLENTNTKNGEILFSCSDMGIGIAQKVRRFLKENPQENLRPDMWKHGSLTDLYKWAFTLGNTTSRKAENKGIGMTMIIDGAHNINMDLSFFDAKSMMQMPKSLFYFPDSLNHEELRKRVYYTKNDVGFYYYGRLKF